ncbi:hypothetical protein Rmet_2558 [Cupriavidus metallidurans CH34]|uniref:Uncharacterized protein n=1 Tax=Cupriavidus metallidurans (strain ATCC 43123 / DSM 2839 / NBRC 102507 / CH34) TaxID=266264 RepID=Q1LK91_CUPMC|nr:hypothetical protein Rmet_2558 [Cupriavidus metallidurans CH34]
MPSESNLAYARRLPQATSTVLRMRFEAELMGQLRAVQNNPALTVKRGRKPSTSVLVRRAVQRYAADISTMDEAELTAEVLAIHRLI